MPKYLKICRVCFAPFSSRSFDSETCSPACACKLSSQRLALARGLTLAPEDFTPGGNIKASSQRTKTYYRKSVEVLPRRFLGHPIPPGSTRPFKSSHPRKSKTSLPRYLAPQPAFRRPGLPDRLRFRTREKEKE